jgi:hypothetical protein
MTVGAMLLWKSFFRVLAYVCMCKMNLLKWHRYLTAHLNDINTIFKPSFYFSEGKDKLHRRMIVLFKNTVTLTIKARYRSHTDKYRYTISGDV